MENKKNLPDVILFAAIYILLALGISFLFTASMEQSLKYYKNEYHIFLRQVIWAGIGTIFLLIFAFIDYHIVLKFSRLFIILSIIMLILVFIPGIGYRAGGSQRWISIGFIRFQPSEFAKLSIILYLSYLFSRKKARLRDFFNDILPPLIVVLIISFLIILQPDLGTAMILFTVAFSLFFLANLKLQYLVFLIIFALLALYLLIIKVPYRLQRVIAFINPWSDPENKGFHIIQSMKAFKVGGITGTGIGNLSQRIILPHSHTDFIFSIIGEQTGFIGASIIIILAIIIFYRTIKISLNAPDDAGRLTAAGIGFLFILQFFINVSVTLGLLPVTGVPLPFISAGGSSLLTFMSAFGIVLNISRNLNK